MAVVQLADVRERVVIVVGAVMGWQPDGLGRRDDVLVVVHVVVVSSMLDVGRGGRGQVEEDDTGAAVVHGSLRVDSILRVVLCGGCSVVKNGDESPTRWEASALQRVATRSANGVMLTVRRARQRTGSPIERVPPRIGDQWELAGRRVNCMRTLVAIGRAHSFIVCECKALGMELDGLRAQILYSSVGSGGDDGYALGWTKPPCERVTLGFSMSPI